MMAAKSASIAAPAHQQPRLNREATRQLILQLCQGRYLTARSIATLLNRNPHHIHYRFLTPMVRENVLAMRYGNEPNRPDQAYTTTGTGDSS